MRGEASQGGGGMKPSELAAKLVEIVAEETGCTACWAGPDVKVGRGPLTHGELLQIERKVGRELRKVRIDTAGQSAEEQRREYERVAGKF
jgi:hypothetical protein